MRLGRLPVTQTRHHHTRGLLSFGVWLNRRESSAPVYSNRTARGRDATAAEQQRNVLRDDDGERE
jgi:hypothetical protein